MVYYAYVLQSENYNTYYYGSTKDLQVRLKEHNAGKVRYTKGRRPWKLHYYEKYESRSEAMKREKFFKSIDGYNYLKESKIIY
jgi:putative endonuclease